VDSRGGVTRRVRRAPQQPAEGVVLNSDVSVAVTETQPNENRRLKPAA
jgi:hypothetical protein